METEDKIDRLLHDAEHAEAGAEFAQRMMAIDPTNAEHREARDSLRQKARDLRAEAERLGGSTHAE